VSDLEQLIAQTVEGAVERAVAKALESRGSSATPVLFASVAKFAAMSGYSESHVAALVVFGLPTVGFGKARRIDVELAVAWLRARTESPLKAKDRRSAAKAAALASVAARAAAKATRPTNEETRR
jgi:hypothetical protein